ALRQIAADAASSRALASEVAARLAHPDATVRCAALAVALAHPAAFAQARQPLLDALQAPRRDDCAALAWNAAARWFVLPPEQAIALLGARNSIDAERGLHSLRELGADALPLLPRILTQTGMGASMLRPWLDELHARWPGETEAALIDALPTLP